MRILIERRRRLVQMFMLSIMTMIMYRRRHIPRMLIVNRDEERRFMLKRMYRESDRLCHEQLRMKRSIFLRLCSRLRGYGLRNSRHLDVEEQVALFLNTVGHDKRNRSSCFGFLRSGHTISIYFHRVLSSILRLHNDIVKPATEANSPADGGSHRSWHHHFQDAVGAIDGTHVKTTVAEEDQARYRNRLNFISQNVLVACTFDMKFTYVLVEWEGSAHDGRLLRSVVSRNGSRLTVPNGKYYLADAGFPLVPKLLTPYRGTRYHLRDVAGQRPTNENELFNFRHSSLRMVVERTIGLLKKRFAYLRHHPYHDIDTQAKVVLACSAIHNFLREGDPDDHCSDDESEDSEEEEEDEDEDEEEESIVIAKTPEWTNTRNQMAMRMWDVRKDEP